MFTNIFSLKSLGENKLLLSLRHMLWFPEASSQPRGQLVRAGRVLGTGGGTDTAGQAGDAPRCLGWLLMRTPVAHPGAVTVRSLFPSDVVAPWELGSLWPENLI